MVSTPHDLAPHVADRHLRDSGIGPVGRIPWGSHFCGFYEQERDLLDILIPYFAAGVQNNEFCLWVCVSSAQAQKYRDEFRTRIREAEQYLNAGNIEFLAADTWYIDDGSFAPDQVLDDLEDRLNWALERGYAGMRVQGNEAWLTKEIWPEFCDYEQSLHRVIHGKPILVLCTYPLKTMLASALFDVTRTHEFTLARRHGEWEILESAEAVVAKAELKEINERLESMVHERTAELVASARQLEEREALYRSITENMSEAVALFEPDRTRLYASPSFFRVVGDIPKRGFVTAHPEDRARMQEAWDKALEGEDQNITFRLHHPRDPQGKWRWIEATIKPLTFLGKDRVLVVKRDVTDKVQLEEQLHHAQKMEALGRLAGGVAHDFNNLLTAIYGYADLASREIPADSAAADSLEEIRLATDRAQRVTRQLLTFSRHDIRQPQAIDLPANLGSLERMLRLLLREDVRFELRTCDHPISVFMDPTQFEQLLVNLVANARDATAAGGTITISCDLVDDSGGRAVGLPEYVRPDRYARVQVTDTGVGMPQEIRDRAFEPFYTTKPAGVGTGLGLSTVFGIVKQAGGFVWIDSEPGKGTTVSVLLPIARTAAKPPARRRRTRQPISLARTAVLLVEDEDVVRHFAAKVLRRSGADVIDVSTPREALGYLGDSSVKIDLLISDVVMPGMNGPALVALARRARPRLKALLMSGYVADEDVTSLRSDTPLLEKPFRPDDLLESVRSILSQASPTRVRASKQRPSQ